MQTFGKKNFVLIAISMLFILFGFILMAGGNSVDGISFNEEIFSTTKIIIAPIICVIGFILMIFAIMINPNKKNK